MSAESYIIRGGREGRERLRLLSRVMHATTQELFDKIDIQACWRCLDAGCGGGDVSFELAGRLGACGAVVGMDIDAQKIALAREEARAAGMGNVSFECYDFTESGQTAEFDMLYTRFLLSHLPQPLNKLQNMRKMLKPGGLFVAEDTDFRGHFCHPPQPAFDRYVEWFMQTAAQRGANANIGAELPHLLQEAGFKDVKMHIVQPVGMRGEVKEISPMTLENVADSIVKAGVADAASVKQTITELYAIARDTTTLMSIPRIVQVWAYN